MTQHTLSYKRPTSEASSMQDALQALGWEFRTIAHSVWQAKGDGGVVTFYTSGKVVIQTKSPDTMTEILGLSDAPQAKKKGSSSKSSSSKSSGSASNKAPTSTLGGAAGRLEVFEAWRTGFGPPDVTTWIGIDEAGKGDFFGPLITAAVRVEKKDLGWLAELGVGDSKEINDRNIRPFAAQIKKAFKGAYSIIVLMPPKYNELYEKFNNLNRMLAWTHAASAEDILANQPAQLILSDQFTKRPIVPQFFKGPGKDCRFVQQTKAESDAAVGAASILARAEFLWRMDELESQFGVSLNKGAGPPTIRDAKRFVSRHGIEAIGGVAKTHFKTMQRLV